MKNGVILINKDAGLSSQAVVTRVKRLFSEGKAGHTGTLDPMATGVLPVLLGRGVKASEYMLSSDKRYRAVMLLGVETDTEDVSGNVLRESDDIPAEAEVISAVNSMLGESEQIPPMYSALKVGGKKLCDLAREGITIEREARKIFVEKIEAKKLSEREYEIEVFCSKGTYIRTLIADIGKKLACGATMKALTRIYAAGFSLSECYTLGELEEMSEDERDSLIIPIENIFTDYKKITLPPFFARLARCGVEIYEKKLGMSLSLGERVKLFDEKGFFAIGEVRSFDAGVAIKPIKQFDV